MVKTLNSVHSPSLAKVVKFDIENDNVVSTLSNVAHINTEIHNVVTTLIGRCPSRDVISIKVQR